MDKDKLLKEIQEYKDKLNSKMNEIDEVLEECLECLEDNNNITEKHFRQIEKNKAFLELLDMYWNRGDCAWLRMGQLLSIVAKEKGKDVFYLEDDEVLEWLVNRGK